METQDIALATVSSFVAIFFALIFLAPNVAQPFIETFANAIMWVVKIVAEFLARLIFGA